MTLGRRALMALPLLSTSAGAQTRQPRLPCVQQPGDIVGLLLAGGSGIASFGQAFIAGDLPAGAVLGARDTSGAALPAQCDIKTRHPDGSARFAVVALRGAAGPVMLTRLGTAAAPMNLTAQLARHSLSVMLGGQRLDLMAPLRDALARRPWQAGALVAQGRVALPVTGVAVTSLRLVADIALLADGACAVDVWLRNDGAMRPGGGRVTYALRVVLDGAEVLATDTMLQHQYTGWGRLLHSGPLPPLVRHDAAYLARAGAVARYNLATGVDEALLAGMAAAVRAPGWSVPLGARGITQQMGMGGARADIGPATQSQAIWLMTGDARAAAYVIGQAEAAGAIPWHFWDAAAGGWMDTARWPGLWTDGRGGPPPGGLAQPIAADTGWSIASSHQPDLSTVPYLLTGRRAFLDGLQAQACWNVLGQWPGTRGSPTPRQPAEGVNLSRGNQVRGAAWALRQLDNAAWASPDDDPQAPWLRATAAANWGWLKAQLPRWTASQGEAHGWIPGEYGIPGLLPPWQQDYFASTAAATARRGNADATAVLAWMGNFLAGRFLSEARGFSPRDGVAYLLAMNADASARAPLRSWAEVGAATRARSLSNGDGWSKTEGDYAQLALASLAALWDVTGTENARQAYAWLSRADAPFTRPEAYRRDPALNIVPLGMPGVLRPAGSCSA